ncbi:dihydrodipicolinate synthase family protein [Amnibacterium flavum]|uniref:Dihydrodipicolinate synthase family protein n=1 Tax=Amnibacterium flavum TaxID=2173173 RepID=A0A2V1HLQ6_9MICO|nr:dihydrodipicolinate synthase family protein [Amnibacterium flavum]PVZ93385.1 dihydrodipicolinate synthase family protein [Amnibacterium flavum]
MAVLQGVIPVAPTVFRDDESLDIEGQRRVADFLVDAGSAAVCILANYSEQFSLDDAERKQVVAATVAQVDGRVPVMVTTSHYSARIAAQRSRAAQDAGAEIVMLMPPFFGATMAAGEQAVVYYFATVADSIDIDIMVQDAPLSTTRLSTALIARLAREIPQVRYAKIEVPRAAQKLRDLAALSGDDLPGLFDGEESVTLIPDLWAGAIGTMCSAMVPDILGGVVSDYLAGDRDGAELRWESVLPLIHYENRQCGLRAAKIALAAGKVIASDRSRAPFDDVSRDTRTELLRLLRRADPLVLNWN